VSSVDGRGERDCIESMCDWIGGSEDQLVDQVMLAAAERGMNRAPRSMEAWRDSIRGLTDAISQAVYGVSEGYVEGLAHRDPVVAYGIIRARTHHGRGVKPADWLALLRLYREAYLEVVSEMSLTDAERSVCHTFIHRVFDRFEAGFRDGYVFVARDDAALTAEA
jgi:hypothetical protein